MSVGAVNKQTGDRIPTAGMPAIDDALSLSSTNPVQNAIITAALANKQDATDNNLQTTDKTVVGAVNELKSGLTNVDVALSVPDGTGKNVLLYPFSDTTKTVNGVTFTDNGDGTISTIGQSTARTVFILHNVSENMRFAIGSYILSKSYQNVYITLIVDGYNGNTWVKSLAKSSDTDDVTFTVDYNGYDRIVIYLEIQPNIITDNIVFKPMIRPATITDPTFAPYIPSVESRIEAVESGLDDVQGGLIDLQTITNGIYALAKETRQTSGNVVFTMKDTGRWAGILIVVGNDAKYAIYGLYCYPNGQLTPSIDKIIGSGAYNIWIDNTTGELTVEIPNWSRAELLSTRQFE